MIPTCEKTEMKREEFYDVSLPNALRKAQTALGKKDIVAPMYVLLNHFDESTWYTANTEDVIGIDRNGLYGRRGESVVVTIHGGIDGNGILSSQLLDYVIKGHNTGESLVIEECSLNLDKLYSHNNTVPNLLDGKMPDGTNIPVFSYNELVAGNCPNDFKRFAVVRSLELAERTKSGFQSIDNLVDFSGNASDSQLISYSAGIENATRFVNALRGSMNGFEIWNPFSSKHFNPEVSQARIPVLGGFSRGLDGNNSLLLDGRYLVIPTDSLV